jgi:hypothetical protein
MMDFVVGHPRSGTMFVSRLLDACRAGVSGHELLFPLSWDMVWIPSEFYAGRLDAEPVRRLLRHYRQRPAGTRIDCNWKLAWILPVLLDQFPEARVCHLVRDPHENIRSCMNLDYYGRLWSQPAADLSTRRRNYFLHWMPELRIDGWAGFDPFRRNCAFWTETHRLALAAPPPAPRYLRVSLEALLSDDAAVEGMARFFALEPPPPERLAELRATRINAKEDEKHQVAEARGQVLPPPAEWPPELHATVEEMCGSMARRLVVT